MQSNMHLGIIDFIINRCDFLFAMTQYLKKEETRHILSINIDDKRFKLIRDIFYFPAKKNHTGETLELTGVLRQEMGTYLCIASNNVPPTVSKRYSVDVHCTYDLSCSY